MTRYFPEPYPNESIQSIIVRYARRYGYDSYYYVLANIYGEEYKGKKVNPLFGQNVSRLIENLPEKCCYTIDELICKHTAAPFYKSFMDDEKYEELIESIKYDTQNVNRMIKCNHNILCFCHKCRSEDKKYYGESYLHIEHQIPGNLICSKHGEVLEKVYIPKHNVKIVDIDKIEVLEKNYEINKWFSQEIEIGYKVSLGVDQLLEQSKHTVNRNNTSCIYKNKLTSLGYVGCNGIDRIGIIEKMYNWGSKEYLKKLIGRI